MKVRKVLICVRRLDKGGAEMLESRLAVNLQRQGIEAHLAAQYREEDFKGKECSLQWKKLGVKEVYFLNSAGTFGIIKALIILIKINKKNRYDFIISTNSGLDILVSLVKVLFSFKHIIAFHTYINNEILKHPKIKIWMSLIKKADSFYSITNYVREDVNLKLGLNPNKNKTVYNSIVISKKEDVFFNLRKECNLKENDKIVLLTGRIESRKGFDLAIEYLSGYLKEENVYIAIAGNAYEGNALETGLISFYSELLKKIKLLNLEDKIIFLGFRENLMQIMEQSNLLLHLARHEGFGLVLLEAIYAGLPIVTSHIGGIPEVIQNTSYKTFDLNDKDGILKEVKLLISISPEEKERITNEVKKILPYFSDERRAKEISELLKNII